MRTRQYIGSDTEKLGQFPNFHRSGSIRGMKRLYYGDNALLVKSGSYIYNVTLCPEIYYNESI